MELEKVNNAIVAAFSNPDQDSATMNVVVTVLQEFGIAICYKCDGNGWYSDHSQLHSMRQDLGCDECGCPVQVECETCKQTGLIPREAFLKHIDYIDREIDDSDLPF